MYYILSKFQLCVCAKGGGIALLLLPLNYTGSCPSYGGAWQPTPGPPRAGIVTRRGLQGARGHRPLWAPLHSKH